MKRTSADLPRPTILRIHRAVNQNERGSIEVGKEADLAVMDRTVFDLGVGPIGGAVVEMTMVRGQIVYERSR